MMIPMDEIPNPHAGIEVLMNHQLCNIGMPLRIAELFAGVGGFRIGFEGRPDSADHSHFQVIWSNQWEPATKIQHASDIYVEKWNFKQSEEDIEVYHGENGDIHVNKDIAQIPADEIPDHDLLCGGFPCQDYSVAKTLDKAKGLQGKKGVLWWEIHRIIEEKMPSFVLLENVDRLLKSPSTQRGRDFAVMLASLDDLGYIVEWRMIDASEYGFPQRRKRVFIVAYYNETESYNRLIDLNPMSIIASQGIFAEAFPVAPLNVLLLPEMLLKWRGEWDRLAKITKQFNTEKKNAVSPFKKAGIMKRGSVWTYDVKASFDGQNQSLGDILIENNNVPDEFILEVESLLRDKGWIYQKGGKKELRTTSAGFTYSYNEGPVTFPDKLDKPSRTIITGEGGSGPSRFKHVIVFKPNKRTRERLQLNSIECNTVREKFGLKSNEWFRRLTPIELERLNGFPDNHTASASDGKRAFFMGNALVIGIISKIANELL